MNAPEITSPINPEITPLARTLISGTSVLSDRIRSYDWASTSVGPIESWSETFIATVNLMLHSPFPTILAWGPEMLFLYNDAAIPTLSGKHPAALGARYDKVFEEAWDLVRVDVEACLLRGETSVRDNMRIPIFLDGQLIEHFWSYSLIPVYENGKVAGVYDAFRNTTDVVLAARRLNQSEMRLRLATESAKLGIFEWDTETDRGGWENQIIYEIFGRSPAEGPVNGELFLKEIVHPEDRTLFREAVKRTLQNGDRFHFEGRVFLPDRTVRWIEVNGELQPEEQMPPTRIVGTIRDITESRQAAQVIGENAKRLAELAAIVESSDDVILSKDLNGIITSWNASATRIFGYAPEEMIGASILKIIPEDLHADEKLIIENIRAGRRVEHFETIRRTKDGSLIEVSLTVSPIRDHTGQIVGASKILRDVTSRKRLETSLLQAEKLSATGRMAATIAHEINNPLEAVMNLLFLLRPKLIDAEATYYLQTAEQELTRVSHIARQTLGYYREHAATTSAALGEIARQAIAIYEPRCTASGVRVDLAIHSTRKIAVRRGEMMQVISNLIANAVLAMASGGLLSITVEDTRQPVEGISLKVADNGVGIAPDTLPRVFDAFFTTRATTGTGIGLFIAKQFIEGHGGSISITSSTEPASSHGTTVSIFLPLHTAYENTSDDHSDEP